MLGSRLVADRHEEEREAPEEEHDAVHEAFDEITQHLCSGESKLGSRLAPIFGHVCSPAGTRRWLRGAKLIFRVGSLELSEG